jgi:hypothetical protein
MKRKPTEFDKSRAWPHCDLCHEATPFLFRWGKVNSCIECHSKATKAEHNMDHDAMRAMKLPPFSWVRCKCGFELHGPETGASSKGAL